MFLHPLVLSLFSSDGFVVSIKYFLLLSFYLANEVFFSCFKVFEQLSFFLLVSVRLTNFYGYGLLHLIELRVVSVEILVFSYLGIEIIPYLYVPIAFFLELCFSFFQF
jgi:hypothetical protein